MSDALDRELAPEERRALGEHLAICQACRNCREQFDLLRRAMGHLWEE